jgi:metal-sulfur cluster biosynthetic enzyme
MASSISAEQIPAGIEEAIKSVPEVNDVNVDLVFDPPYNKDMMSDAAKLEFNL